MGLHAVLDLIRWLFSPTVNPGDKFDEQESVNDHESKEEIKSVWHRSLLSVETYRATLVPLWNEDKKCRNRQRFPEKSLILQAQDASVF